MIFMFGKKLIIFYDGYEYEFVMFYIVCIYIVGIKIVYFDII